MGIHVYVDERNLIQCIITQQAAGEPLDAWQHLLLRRWQHRKAEEHREEDKRKRELVEEKNRAEQIVYAARRTLKEHGSKVGEADRNAIEAACSAVDKAREGDDTSAVRRAIEDLEQSMHKLSAALYEEVARKRAEQAAQEAPPGAGGEAPAEEPKKKDDDVIDAEYEVKDDDQK